MRTVTLALTAALVLPLAARADDAADQKAALQALNEYVGDWTGTGGPDKPKPDPKDPSWKEKMSWAWKFEKGTPLLAFTSEGGKHFAGGEMRYNVAKKQYELTATDAKKAKQQFTGKLDAKGYLVLERVDASGETQQLTMNTAGDGARFVVRLARKPKGRTAYTRDWQVAASKEGESLGTAAAKNECIVTGGLGTMPVSYMGKTYYVCCTGCRDAFNESPAKYVKEFEAKKAGK